MTTSYAYGVAYVTGSPVTLNKNYKALAVLI